MFRAPSPLKDADPPGPSAFTDKQMGTYSQNPPAADANNDLQDLGAYLKDLRTNRPPRPAGSRPLPQSSTSKRSSMVRDSTSSAYTTSNVEEPSSRSSSTLSYYMPDKAPPANVSSKRYSHITLESERDPYLRMREKEVEEARTIRKTLEAIDANERDDVYHSAKKEAQHLVSKHKYPYKPYRPETEPRKQRNLATRESRQESSEQKTNHRKDESSVDLDDLIGQYSPTDDVPPIEALTLSKNEESADPGDMTLQKMRKLSTKGWMGTHDSDSDTMEQANRTRPSKRLSQKFSFGKLGSRRKSSGSKHGQHDHCARDFPNDNEKIYEDKQECSNQDERVASHTAVPAHVRRNPFARAASARKGNSTALPPRPWHRTEIHRNEPSRSRDPTYTRNTTSPGTDWTEPRDSSEAGEVKYKNGIEVRSDDIRAATSKRIGDRSRKLPAPTAVSDKPGRPIVSFDPDWKPEEDEEEEHKPTMGTAGSREAIALKNKAHTDTSSSTARTPASSLANRARPPPIPNLPQPSLYELLGEEPPEVLGVERILGRGSPSAARPESPQSPQTPHSPPTPKAVQCDAQIRHRQMPSGTATGPSKRERFNDISITESATTLTSADLPWNKGKQGLPTVSKSVAVPTITIGEDETLEESMTMRHPPIHRSSSSHSSSQEQRTVSRGPASLSRTARSSDAPVVPSIAINGEAEPTRTWPIPSIIEPDAPSIVVSESPPATMPPPQVREAVRGKDMRSATQPAASENTPHTLGERPVPIHSATAPPLTRGHYSPYQAASGSLCAQCALPIAGRIVGAAGALFHPACFKCFTCNERLECVAFYPEPDEKRNERLTHDDDDSLRFYCHLDFHELFSPRCKSCKTPIEGEVVVACGSEWHVGHFFCAQCGDPFDASKPYVEKDGYAWCVQCHHDRFSNKCSRCRQPITDRVLKALGKEWHVRCFCCDECGDEFPDGKFLLREMNGTQGTVCVACEERRLKA